MAIPQTPSPLSTIVTAKTYNAAWFSGATKEAQITAAIANAATDGALYVYVPANMLPYNAALVTFNSTIRMIREGGSQMDFDMKAYGAAGDGTQDDTVAGQTALAHASAVASGAGTGGAKVIQPPGTYKWTSQPVVTGSVKIIGAGNASSINRFYGCDGFSLIDNSGLEDIGVSMYSAGGAADPKTNIGVTLAGTSLVHVNYLRLRNVLVRGASIGIDARYTWDSTFDSVATIFCTKGFRSFGLTGNNAISNSKFLGDSRGVSLEQDSGNHGEGLNIAGTFISGDIGLWADQFIKLSLGECTIDLCGTNAMSLTNVDGSAEGCWFYSGNDTVRFEDLAGYSTNGFKIINCPDIRSTAARSIYIGTFNQHIEVTRSKLQYFTSPYFLASSARYCNIFPNTSVDGSGVSTKLEGGLVVMDADINFTIPDAGAEFGTYFWNVNSTNRTATLPTRASCWQGRKIRIRIGGGAGNLTVKEAAGDGGATIKVLPAATPASCDVEFGTALGTPQWILTNYSVL